MVDVPLSWKLSVSGAEDVKSKLQDIKGQFDRGEISSTNYAKGLREVNRDARTLTRQSDIQKNVFLASHPALNSLSRGMSAFSSVAHTALSISNALNLIWIRQKGDTTELAIAEHDLAQAQRDYAKAVKDSDLVGQAKALEQVRISTAKIKELKDPFKVFFDGVTIFSSLLLGVSATIQVLPRLAIGIKGLTGALEGFYVISAILKTSSIWSQLGFLSTLGGPFLIIGVAAALVGGAIADILVNLLHLEEWRANNGRQLDKFFLETLPTAIENSKVYFGNLVRYLQTDFMNDWNKFWFEDIPNRVKAGLDQAWQNLTGWFENLRKLITNWLAGKGGGSSGSPTNIGPVRPGGRATGFEGYVNSPTAMIVGEAGGEYVSVTPHGKSTSNGMVLVFNNYGTIATEREVFNKFDTYLKSQLKQRGWSNIL